jgi:type IV pilus assembly protein PilE
MGKFTYKEALTALVVLVVLSAIALPMWRAHQLRVRREDATEALRAVQTAQDNYFGAHARYADEAQLQASEPQAMSAKGMSPRGFYQISIRRSDDELTYTATARSVPREGLTEDARCAELRIDQNGRRFAADSSGGDRSADCWH